MKQFPLALVLVCTLIASVCCDCSLSGWYEFDGHCYGAVASKRDWYSAHESCQEYDAELVSIGSQEENDFVQDVLQTRYVDPAWIGFHEINLDHYEWTDGSPTSITRWADGEPNDSNGNEECVSMSMNSGLWNDDHCDKDYYYVCEERQGDQQPATLPPPTSGICPDGFSSEEFSDKCFMIGGTDSDETWLAWKGARDACESYNGGELASIRTPAEQSFITLLMEDVDTDVWIGLFFSGNSWVWMDNTILDYTNYAPNSGYSGDCEAALQDPGVAGMWERRDCDEEMRYLCQAPRVEVEETDGVAAPTDPAPFADQYSDPTCADDYFLFHGVCFKFFAEPQSWDVASEICWQDNDGYLAITLDWFEMARLTYESALQGEAQQTWIGVEFNRPTGSYKWGDDYPVSNTFWAEDEPDLQTDSACVAIADLWWLDEDCSTELPFFCMNGDLPAISTPDWSEKYCPNPDHRGYEDHCYSVSLDDLVTWSEARGLCQAQGMELASIHSWEEDMFLVDYADSVRSGTASWIGLYLDSAWRWSDYSDYSVAIWDDGEPTGGAEGCVVLKTNGEWNDLTCDSQVGYICKTEKVFRSSTTSTTSTTPAAIISTKPAASTAVTDARNDAAVTDARDDVVPTDSAGGPQTDTTDDGTDNSDSSSSATNMSVGAITGSVICALVLIVILALAAFLTVTKRWSIMTDRLRGRTEPNKRQNYTNMYYDRDSHSVANKI